MGGARALSLDAELEFWRTGTCSSCVALHLLSTCLSRHRLKKSLNSGDLKGGVVINRLLYNKTNANIYVQSSPLTSETAALGWEGPTWLFSAEPSLGSSRDWEAQPVPAQSRWPQVTRYQPWSRTDGPSMSRTWPLLAPSWDGKRITHNVYFLNTLDNYETCFVL